VRPSVQVLGTAQDGGIPHAGCRCTTCAAAREHPEQARRVAAIALVGHSGKTLVVDATPDFPAQLERLALSLGRKDVLPDALLLTHAHIGHYLGLAWLGREAMDAQALPVHVTPSMARFLGENRPWRHLVTRGQITLVPGLPGEAFDFDGVRVTPFLSPHRAEDTDTVGVEIAGPTRRLLYLPDADAFPDDVARRIGAVDVALVDGTFWSPEEVGHRDVKDIPHPFVEESLGRLEGARGDVYFTHLNHTNPLLQPDPDGRPVLPRGFRVLEDGDAFRL